jgi:hypothetical protein
MTFENVGDQVSVSHIAGVQREVQLTAAWLRAARTTPARAAPTCAGLRRSEGCQANESDH